MTEQLVLFVVSFIANAFSAFAGGGAGLIQLPALIFLGLPFSLALSTHKVASIALGIGALLRHLRSDNIHFYFSLFILLCGIPGVILGGFLIVTISDSSAEILLGMLTISLGYYSYKKPDLGQHLNETNRHVRGYVLGGLVLLFIGVLNGSLTSGTGLFVTLWLVFWFGLDYKQAVAYTLILVGIFWNSAGAVTLGFLSEIQWDWIPVLLVASLTGGYAGAHMAIKSGNKWIKKVYELITIVVGISLILKANLF